MTDQTKTTDWRERTSTEDLVNHYAVLQERIVSIRENLQRTERMIIERMEAEGATVLDIPGHDVTLKRTTQYDRTMLYPLAELVPPEALAKAFTPAHEETVHFPDKWDMRKVLALAKYGDAVKALINRASFPGAPSLKIVAKESAS